MKISAQFSMWACVVFALACFGVAFNGLQLWEKIVLARRNCVVLALAALTLVGRALPSTTSPRIICFKSGRKSFE